MRRGLFLVGPMTDCFVPVAALGLCCLIDSKSVATHVLTVCS